MRPWRYTSAVLLQWLVFVSTYVHLCVLLLHVRVQFLPREALMARADSLKKAAQSMIDQATDGE